MELEKDTMIEEDLKGVFSDLIYRVTLNGKEVYLYFLFNIRAILYEFSIYSEH